MDNLISWIETKIEGCAELGGMEKEIWAFKQILKKVRNEQLTTSSVVGTLICDHCNSDNVKEFEPAVHKCYDCEERF